MAGVRLVLDQSVKVSRSPMEHTRVCESSLSAFDLGETIKFSAEELQLCCDIYGVPTVSKKCSTCRRIFVYPDNEAVSATCLSCLEQARRRSHKRRNKVGNMYDEGTTTSTCCTSCKRYNLQSVDFRPGRKTCTRCLLRVGNSKRKGSKTWGSKLKNFA